MSLATIHADIRAAFRNKLLTGSFPSVTFTTALVASGNTLSAASEPGLDFAALGFRPGAYPLIEGLGKASGQARRIIKVEATKLTFDDKLGANTSAVGAKVSLKLGGDAWAWEGEAFTPTKGVPFGREVVMSSGSVPAALGRGGAIRHKITSTATLFYPAGQGTLGIESMAGRLLEQFKPGDGMVYGSSQGVVTKAYLGKLLQEPEWITCPVVVETTAWTMN